MELILYSPGTRTFNNMGLGVIQCTRAEATTGLNDIMELEFDAPITGRHYAEIQKDCIVTAPHDDTKKRQPYKIYKSSAPIDGIVTFWARHISYDLNTVTIRPNAATSCAQAMGNMETYAINPRGFTFWTDVTTAGEFAVTVPTPCRKLLGGSKGSILDIYGGEFEFDHWDVKLHARLGRDTDVNIVYGKNLVSIKNDIDNGSTYNAIVPFWYSEQDGLVTIDGYIVKRANMPATEPIRALPVDMSSDFQTKPTNAQLQTEAEHRLASGKPWLPTQNVKVDFIALWQTAEYVNIAPLQRLTLGDTGIISVPAMGIVNERQKVVKTVYNVLTERYNKMELGQLKASFSQVVTAQTEEKIDALPTKSFLQAAIEHATQLITGGLGGYVRFTLNADGEPEEILIMDTPSTSTAVNVWRFNKNGLGHSHSGYNGPYDDVALTADGKINASMIVTGLMSANRIHGGTLKLGGGSNGGNGVMQVFDANNNLIGTFDKDGIKINRGTITSANGRAYIDLNNNIICANMLKSPSAANQLDTVLEVAAENGTSNVYIYANGYKSKAAKITVSRTGATLMQSAGGGSISLNAFNDTYSANNATLEVSASTVRGLFDFNANTRNGEYTRLYSDADNNRMRIQGGLAVSDQISANGLAVSGTKNRIVRTTDYGERLQYCYETPSPMFGDIGEGALDASGICYVSIDDIFAETTRTDISYQVFLQKEGRGDLWIAEKTPAYFVVEGTPNLSFAWELKAKQKDYEFERLEEYDADSSDVIVMEIRTAEYQYKQDEQDFINEQEALLYETA